MTIAYVTNYPIQYALSDDVTWSRSFSGSHADGRTIYIWLHHGSPLVATPAPLTLVTTVGPFTDGTRTGYISLFKRVMVTSGGEDGTLFGLTFEQTTSGPFSAAGITFSSSAGTIFESLIATGSADNQVDANTINVPAVTKGTTADAIIVGAGVTNFGTGNGNTQSGTTNITDSISNFSFPYSQIVGGRVVPGGGAPTSVSGQMTFAAPAGSYTSSWGAISVVLEELTLNVEMDESVTVTEVISLGTPDEEDTTDTVNLTEGHVARAVYPKTLSDVLSALGTLAPRWVLPAATSDAASVGAALGWIDAPALRDTIATSELLGPQGIFGRTATDAATLGDLARLGIPSALSDTVDLSLTVETVLALRVVEALGLGSVLAANAVFGRSQLESVTLSDSLRQFFSGELLDQVDLTTTVTDAARFRNATTEALGLTDALGNTLVLRVTAADTVDVTPEMALQLLYRPNLADGVELSAAYVAPDSSITTWAVNAKTGAVSEYENYEFNSFAASGVKYLGASDTGLYELNGDGDDATDVIGRLKSGFLSFAGSRFSGFRATYIGVRGPGDYVFRLTTGDDKTYTYAVDVRRMETTKILMGKGIRSSYFAFELISTGQDFDLDFVEFVPARANRRV